MKTKNWRHEPGGDLGLDTPQAYEDAARLLTMTATCPECGRTFDLADEAQAEEWYFGHDCEES